MKEQNLSFNVMTSPSPQTPADINAVLAAIDRCSSHDAAIRRPAEEALKNWEFARGCGYLVSLLTIVGTVEGETNNQQRRLLGAILLKNAIPKVFTRRVINDKETSTMFQREEEERCHVRATLPTLLFNTESIDEAIALQLSLALTEIASCDFPHRWPTLLEDLAGVASLESSSYVIRIHAVRTLRRCLRSVRLRKATPIRMGVAGVGGEGGPIPIFNMANFQGMLSQAANERKETHQKACSIFDAVATGITGHARASIVAIDQINAVDSWRSESIIAVGFIKCMTELLPMVEVDDDDVDPRSISAVRDLMGILADVFDATKVYNIDYSSVLKQEYASRMDKVHRASLVCCMISIRVMPHLFASRVPGVLHTIVETLLNLDASVLHSMPIKRLVDMMGFVRNVLTCVVYYSSRQDGSMTSISAGNNNAILAALGNSKRGMSSDRQAGPDNPGVVAARETVTSLLADGVVDRLCEALIGKFLRLRPDEIEEWENDPEGRYESDLAERTLMEANSPRHVGAALLLTLLDRETDRVAQTLMRLATLVQHQQFSEANGEGMLDREACYRALELCRVTMVGGGQRRVNFSDWFRSELGPMLQSELREQAPVPTRVMQARAVQVVQAFSTSLHAEEFGVAFEAVARQIAAQDLVTAFCAARCINHLSLLHVRGEKESDELVHVRKYSVLALGNAFSLANRTENEECLRVVLMCISALVEANGLYLEPVLHAIAEQLPCLWERAKDSVSIHSSLLSVLTHLIMKMGHTTVEHEHVQKVLFPLLDYCTDISVANRADNLLEDGLKLWLVLLVSSRLETMGQMLRTMLPRLDAILRSELEPHLSLKVLQYYAILLGPEILATLSHILRELLLRLVSNILIYGDNEDVMDSVERVQGIDRGSTTMKGVIASFDFSEAIMQMQPELGVSICAPAVFKAVAALAGPGKKAITLPLYEPIFSCLSRVLWTNPNFLDEICASDPNQDEKLSFVVDRMITMVTSVTRQFVVLMSAQAQKVVFISQKGAALALCSAVCHSSRVARETGQDVLAFTRRVLEIETTSKGLDLEALVDAACGSTRKVVGDGPLGDYAARMPELLKSE